MQVAPGDAHHGVPGHGEHPIAGAVAFERGPRGVTGVAVELDDDALLAPQAVDLDALDENVDLRPGQATGIEEGEEAVFELAPGDRLADPAFFEDGPDRGCAPLPAVAVDEVIERERVGEAEELGLVHRPLCLPTGGDRGEIEERSRD